MMKNSRKKMAIVRALDIRLIQAEYATCFRKFKAFFVSNANKEIVDYLRRKKTAHINLKLKPYFLFDPICWWQGKLSPQSWVNFDRKSLEKELKMIDFYQIQELFFMYSGQIADVARKFDKPLIAAPWMCFNHLSSYIPPYSISVKKVAEQTDLFILRTKRVNDYLSYFNISDKKKVLIYHGVNTKRFYPPRVEERQRVEAGPEKEIIKILFVGQLTCHKGLDDILDILPQLVRETKKKVELIVCGEGDLKKRVMEMSKSLPINYMGNVSNLVMPKVHRNSDIFCGPSKDWFSLGIKRTEEGFGLVFAEALASGLPIVTSDSGAIKEVVGDKNFVNKQGDKQALLGSLLELIGDNKLRQSVGRSNRLRALDKFDMKKQVKKEEEVIKRRFA